MYYEIDLLFLLVRPPWPMAIKNTPPAINNAPKHHLPLTCSPSNNPLNKPVTKKFTAELTTVTGREPFFSRAFKYSPSATALNQNISKKDASLMAYTIFQQYASSGPPTYRLQ